jgi:hypothetical protein
LGLAGVALFGVLGLRDVWVSAGKLRGQLTLT